jgi:vacuolar-type H+-ATPase subunit H
MDKELMPQNQKDSRELENFSQSITANRFAYFWAKLCAAYPRQSTSGAMTEIFFEQLGIYTEAEVSDAINGVIATSKWFPSVAEIIEQIKGEHHCPHRLALAELRIKQAEFDSRQQMLLEAEKYADRRYKEMTQKCAELENKSIELYKRERQMIEESGLGEAQAKLNDINARIQEQEHILTILKQKVKLFDQARILQADGQ